jgi:hypothetical protein
MLFYIVELHSVITPKLKCLFAMVNRIKYTPVANIIDYSKNAPKMSCPIECTFMVLSAKTHRWASTGNTRARGAGASIRPPYSSNAR